MNFRYRLLIRLRPVLRFVKFRILHVDDSPQRMARGIAIGLFTAYLPFFGLHMLVALALAWLMRANKVLAVLSTWISNPLTFVILYYPAYRLGRVILSLFRTKTEVELQQLQALFTHTFSLETMVVNLFDPDYWKEVGRVFTLIGTETFIGGFILGLLAGLIGYRIAFYTIIGYRTRKQERRKLWKRTLSK